MGATYKIIVSEPWDYRNSSGENVVYGQITERINPTSVVFRSAEHFNVGDRSGSLLLLSPRFPDQSFSSAIDDVSVNGSLIDEFNADAVLGDAIKSSAFVLIGTLRVNE